MRINNTINMRLYPEVSQPIRERRANMTAFMTVAAVGGLAVGAELFEDLSSNVLQKIGAIGGAIVGAVVGRVGHSIYERRLARRGQLAQNQNDQHLTA